MCCDHLPERQMNSKNVLVWKHIAILIMA